MSQGCFRSVEAYVDDLVALLRVGRRSRRRIAEEVTGHLTELVAEEEAGGLTPQAAARRAAARFGSPADLAAEFNRDAAAHAVRRAAWALAACVSVAFVAAGGALRGWGPAAPWPDPTVYHAAPELLVQVAGVCVLNALLLAVLAPAVRGVALDARGLRLAVRSLTVAAVALAPVAVVAAGNLGGGSAWGQGALQAATVVTAAGGACLTVGAVRIGRIEGGSGGESALDVLAATILALADRWNPARRAADLVTARWATAVAHAPRAMAWLELRRHPWRTALTVSVAAGIALKSGDLVLKGEVDAAAAGVEAAAVFVAYVLLGGLLGLRETRRRSAAG